MPKEPQPGRTSVSGVESHFQDNKHEAQEGVEQGVELVPSHKDILLRGKQGLEFARSLLPDYVDAADPNPPIPLDRELTSEERLNLAYAGLLLDAASAASGIEDFMIKEPMTLPRTHRELLENQKEAQRIAAGLNDGSLTEDTISPEQKRVEFQRYMSLWAFSAADRQLERKSLQFTELERDQIYLLAVRALERRLHFFQQAIEQCAPYTQERTSENLNRDIRRIDSQHRHREIQRLAVENPNGAIPDVLKELPRDFARKIRSEISSVELNDGCTVGCSFCAFSARPKITNALRATELHNLLLSMPHPDMIYYRSTDPLDFQAADDASYDYRALIDDVFVYRGELPYTSTAYPKSAREKRERFLPIIHRLSIGSMNIQRLEEDGLVQRIGRVIVPADPTLADTVFFGNIHDISKQVTEILYGATDADKAYARGLALFGNMNERRLSDVFDYDDNLNVAGRQRKINAKREGGPVPFGRTIDCRDDVVWTPKAVHNSLPLFATDAFPDGGIRVELDYEALKNGRAAMEHIAQRVLQDDQQVTVAEVLQHGLVQNQYGNIALYFKNVKMLRQCTVRFYGQSPEERVRLTKSYAPHRSVLETINESGQVTGVWECIYHLMDGTVLSLQEIQSIDRDKRPLYEHMVSDESGQKSYRPVFGADFGSSEE